MATLLGGGWSSCSSCVDVLFFYLYPTLGIWVGSVIENLGIVVFSDSVWTVETKLRAHYENLPIYAMQRFFFRNKKKKISLEKL